MITELEDAFRGSKRKWGRYMYWGQIPIEKAYDKEVIAKRWDFLRNQIYKENEFEDVYKAFIRSFKRSTKGLWLITELKDMCSELTNKISSDLGILIKNDFQELLENKDFRLHDVLLGVETDNHGSDFIYNCGKIIPSNYDNLWKGTAIQYPDFPSIDKKHILILPIDFAFYLDSSYQSPRILHKSGIKNFFDRTATQGITYVEMSKIL